MSASAGDTIDLSLNEIEMTALKAVRGAGLSWSIAEDAGRAARLLAALGLDWSGLLLDALKPEVALDADASPFLAGARLLDLIDGLSPSEEMRASVLRPVWLFAMLAANAPEAPVFTLSIGSGRYCVGGGTAAASGLLGDLAAIGRAEIVLRADAERLPRELSPERTRSIIPAVNHAALEVLVYRTYVPNSEKSRLRGAGARPGI